PRITASLCAFGISAKESIVCLLRALDRNRPDAVCCQPISCALANGSEVHGGPHGSGSLAGTGGLGETRPLKPQIARYRNALVDTRPGLRVSGCAWRRLAPATPPMAYLRAATMASFYAN